MYFVNFFSNEVTRELIVSSSGKFDQAYASLQKLYGGQVVLKQKHYYTIIFTECSKNLVLSKKIEIENWVFFWVRYFTPSVYFYILIWSESKDEMAGVLHYYPISLIRYFSYVS